MINQLIINTEYFLQCAGSCSGCFLSSEERDSLNNFHDEIKLSILKLLNEKELPEKFLRDFLVIGFGRGNNLALSLNELEKMGQLIQYIEKNFKAEKIIFEVSSSLIGKIDTQITNAIYLLGFSKNIYFNIVVNSEITSKQFWSNLKLFHEKLTLHRQSWGWSDNTGDILVLNINPQKLPDLAMLANFSQGIQSPINISFFPYDIEVKNVIQQEQKAVVKWTEDFIELFKEKDLNIKNYLSIFDFEMKDIHDVKTHIEKTQETYFFIDKKGQVTNGIPSIMGEIDFPRLMDKYKLKPDINKAFNLMQKNTSCMNCNYQKHCLASGAYLNMMANNSRLEDKTICPSGYKVFFEKLINL